MKSENPAMQNLDKAPADIVEKEKEKLKGYEEKREAVKQRLAYLATL